MSGHLCINLRIFYWHLMVGKGFSSITIEKNEFWLKNGLKGIKKIEVYTWDFKQQEQ